MTHLCKLQDRATTASGATTAGLLFCLIGAGRLLANPIDMEASERLEVVVSGLPTLEGAGVSGVNSCRRGALPAQSPSGLIAF